LAWTISFILALIKKSPFAVQFMDQAVVWNPITVPRLSAAGTHRITLPRSQWRSGRDITDQHIKGGVFSWKKPSPMKRSMRRT
jgi:hypothetical protein